VNAIQSIAMLVIYFASQLFPFLFKRKPEQKEKGRPE